jgi:hypothetical protein
LGCGKNYTGSDCPLLSFSLEDWAGRLQASRFTGPDWLKSRPCGVLLPPVLHDRPMKRIVLRLVVEMLLGSPCVRERMHRLCFGFARTLTWCRIKSAILNGERLRASRIDHDLAFIAPGHALRVSMLYNDTMRLWPYFHNICLTDLSGARARRDGKTTSI